MRRFLTPAERLWFVVVTAPLVIGAIPLTLALVPIVGGLSIGRLGSSAALFGAFLGMTGVAGLLGVVTARRIHRGIDPASYLGRTVNVTETVARATIVVFGVYIAGVILIMVSFVLPETDFLDPALELVLIPFSPVFLLPAVGVRPLERMGVFVLAGMTTGVWQIFLGLVVGRLVERITAS